MRVVALLILWVPFAVACGAAPPPAATPRPPASAAPSEVAPPEEPEPEPDAPSRSFFMGGTRTIGGGPAETRRTVYRGARIDLDVKGADIQEVCRLIADVGRVNIVVSDDVKGSVTVKMKGVPWDQALDTILRAKGFRAERDGSIILVTR